MDSGSKEMKSSLHVNASLHAYFENDKTVILDISGRPPITLKETQEGIMIVNSAGGPLRGDTSRIEMVLDDFTSLSVGSIGASVAQGGVNADSYSQSNVTLKIGSESNLRWIPKPLIISEAADHVSHVAIEMRSTSTVIFSEILVLGRHNQNPGRFRSRWEFRMDGRPILIQDLDVGQGNHWPNAVMMNGSRILVSAFAFNPKWSNEERVLLTGPTTYGEVFELAEAGILLQALVSDSVMAEEEMANFLEMDGLQF